MTHPAVTIDRKARQVRIERHGATTVNFDQHVRPELVKLFGEEAVAYLARREDSRTGAIVYERAQRTPPPGKYEPTKHDKGGLPF